jgi:hypothetical protein
MAWACDGLACKDDDCWENAEKQKPAKAQKRKRPFSRRYSVDAASANLEAALQSHSGVAMKPDASLHGDTRRSIARFHGLNVLINLLLQLRLKQNVTILHFCFLTTSMCYKE